MSDLFSNIFGKYGIKFLLITVVLAIVIWFIAHISAAPGTEVSILWGLVRYTKPIENKSDLYTQKENSAAEKNEETNTSDSDSSFLPISIFIKNKLNNTELNSCLISYRNKNGVRELSTLESGKPARDLPNGIYSYVSVFYMSLESKSISYALLNISSSRFKTMDSYFEIHYINKQNILILGFTTEKDASEISYLNGVDKHSIIMSPTIFGEFYSLVVIPANRIIDSNDRSIEVSKHGWYPVLDLVVK